MIVTDAATELEDRSSWRISQLRKFSEEPVTVFEKAILKR